MSDLQRDIYEVSNQLGGYVGPGTEAHLAKFLIREANEAAKLADEIVRIQRDLEKARRYAFFVGWEMCETAGAEDTCADAFAFWSLMEDGRDEVEGRALRAKAEETQG